MEFVRRRVWDKSVQHNTSPTHCIWNKQRRYCMDTRHPGINIPLYKTNESNQKNERCNANCMFSVHTHTHTQQIKLNYNDNIACICLYISAWLDMTFSILLRFFFLVCVSRLFFSSRKFVLSLLDRQSTSSPFWPFTNRRTICVCVHTTMYMRWNVRLIFILYLNVSSLAETVVDLRVIRMHLRHMKAKCERTQKQNIE